jgi:hypothetical protein
MKIYSKILKGKLKNGNEIKADFHIEKLGSQNPYFSVTGESYYGGGCSRREIQEVFPKYARYIKWHLMTFESPMHYIANSLYWAGLLGWITGKSDSPPNIEHLKSICIYGALESDYKFNLEKVLFNKKGIRVSSLNPIDRMVVLYKTKLLKDFLNNRLPALMQVFRKDMQELFPDLIVF